MPGSNNTTYDHDAVNTLYTEFGAQLLRVKADKTPAEGRGWIDRQLTLDDALEHVDRGGNLGLVPASIGMVAVDVDEGNCDSLLHNFVPVAAYRTKRPGGVHAYFQHDGPPVRQRRWVAPLFEAAGDLRHSRGYVCLWRPDQLVNDLERGSAGVPFAEIAQTFVTPAPQGGPKSPPATSAPTPDNSPSPARSRHAWVKARLIAARVDGMDGVAIRAYALQLHAGLVQPPGPVPHYFPLSEAMALANWIAGRDWSHDTQRERGLRSGQHRRARTADRDQRIVAMLRAGRSQRETGRMLGVSRGTVEQVKRRELAGDGDKSH